MERDINGLNLGAELCFNVYFSGGFFLALGFDWNMNMLKIDPQYTLANTQTYLKFYENKTSSQIHTFSFIISAGYAFFN